MTKVMDWSKGIQLREEKKLKPIEFVYYLNDIGTHAANNYPSDFDNIALIGECAWNHLSIIIAWDDHSKGKLIYLGHWNDGVV